MSDPTTWSSMASKSILDRARTILINLVARDSESRIRSITQLFRLQVSYMVPSFLVDDLSITTSF
jgi:hypothetical protein